MLELISGILWLYRRTIGRAFLLAIVSWVLLTVLWNQSQVGSPTFKFIAAIFHPGWALGLYVARLLSAGRYTAPLISVGALLLFFTVFWYAAIRLASKIRYEERVGGIPPQ